MSLETRPRYRIYAGAWYLVATVLCPRSKACAQFADSLFSYARGHHRALSLGLSLCIGLRAGPTDARGAVQNEGIFIPKAPVFSSMLALLNLSMPTLCRVLNRVRYHNQMLTHSTDPHGLVSRAWVYSAPYGAFDKRTVLRPTPEEKRTENRAYSIKKMMNVREKTKTNQ